MDRVCDDRCESLTGRSDIMDDHQEWPGCGFYEGLSSNGTMVLCPREL